MDKEPVTANPSSWSTKCKHWTYI